MRAHLNCSVDCLSGEGEDVEVDDSRMPKQPDASSKAISISMTYAVETQSSTDIFSSSTRDSDFGKYSN